MTQLNLQLPSQSIVKSLATLGNLAHEDLLSDRPEAVRAAKYLNKERKLKKSVVVANKLGLVTERVVELDPGLEHVLNWITIPYWNLKQDKVSAIKFADPDRGPVKYKNMAGTSARIYGAPGIYYGGSTIYVVEGEIDKLTLEQCGVLVVSVSGAGAWDETLSGLLEGFQHVIVIQDNDGRGDGERTTGDGKAIQAASALFFEKIHKDIPWAVARKMPEGYDVNSYYREYGEEKLLDYVKVKEYEQD